jgi:hypothetical protein
VIAVDFPKIRDLFNNKKNLMLEVLGDGAKHSIAEVNCFVELHNALIVHISCLLDRNTMFSFAMLGRRICKLGLKRRSAA